jgi:hypothetical protein
VNYATEMGSGAMIYILSFIKTGLGNENFLGRNTHTDKWASR